MAKHQTQHKESREKRNAKEMRELRSENNSLRRKIAKLQKYVQKMLDERNDVDEVIGHPQQEHVGKKQLSVAVVNSCESCASTDIMSVDIPGGKLSVCKKCGWRKRYV